MRLEAITSIPSQLNFRLEPAYRECFNCLLLQVMLLQVMLLQVMLCMTRQAWPA